MRSFNIILLLLILASGAYSQEYHKLQAGQLVPDIDFPVILNSNTLSHARLSDFKGKVVILDYWNIWCSGCLKAFPKLLELQEKFQSDLVILPVSFLHTSDVISDFVQKRKGTEREIGLPLAVFENTQNQLFEVLPTLGYPHCVWIDRAGRLLQTSTSLEVNEENIRKVLNGDRLNVPQVNYQMNFDLGAPFLLNGNGGPDTAFVYRSLLSPYLDSIQSRGLRKYKNDRYVRLFVANVSVAELVKLSLYQGRSIDPSNQYLVLEGVDAASFRWSQNEGDRRTWDARNAYCYDLVLPTRFSLDNALKYMQREVEDLFQIKASLEDRLMDCLVLTMLDSTKLPRSPKKGPAKYTSSVDGLQRKMEHSSLERVLSGIYTLDSPILIDETGYHENVDIQLSVRKPFDLVFLNEQLRKYGLCLKPAQRIMNVVVIKSNKRAT